MSTARYDPYRRQETEFHLIPGRLRMGVPGLLNNQELANQIAHGLAQCPGVRISYANPITGRVLINFDPARTDLELVLFLIFHAGATGPLPALAPGAEAAPEPERESPGPPPDGTTPWHTMDGPGALALLGSSLENGLSRRIAGERLSTFGPNALPEGRKPTFGQLALASLDGFMSRLLAVAGGVSLLVGEAADASVIAFIVVIQAVVEAAQRCRAERSLDDLKELSAPLANALREGEVQRIPGRELVPGDILHLGAGDVVPADAMILEEANLTTNEACLTGESIPVVKDNRREDDPRVPVADRANMLFSGTSVTGGRATALVVETGMRTELGRIARLLGEVRVKKTGLQRQMDQLGRRITWLVGVSVGTIALIYLLRGRSIWEVLRTGISLAVGAVPEGLPAVLTVALSTGVQRMAKRNALVRNMSAVETLGSATVICTDKTGTLTRNEMTVKELYTARTCYRFTGEGYRPEGRVLREGNGAGEDTFPLVLETLKIAALCNNAELQVDAAGKWTVRGDPTEGALLTAAAKAGLWWQDLKKEYCRHREIAFDARRRLMTVICREPDGAYGIYVKGAPDAVLNCCPAAAGPSGGQALDLRTRHRIISAAETMARKALRVLAVAGKRLPPGTDSDQLEPEEELHFHGLIGMADPPRQGVREAVARCRDAGIGVVMITGDHQKTAEAVAAGLGILDGGRSITGAELDRIPDTELAAQAGDIAVYSRTTPDHKLRIVRALKGCGQIVAMTGDGVNDAPAIKEADVGIAMGRTGTDVTRGVAGITLSDDNFVTIVDGIEEGRTVGANLAKSVRYIISGSIGQLLTVFTAASLGLPAPMLPAQTLWVNLVTESLPAISLTADPPEGDCMNRPPLPPEGRIFSGQSRVIFRKGLLFGMATFALYAAGLTWGRWSLARARTMAFSQTVINRVFNLIHERRAGGAGPAAAGGGNPLIIPAAALSATMLAATMYLPFMRPLFSTVPLGLKDWLLLTANALAASRIDSCWRADPARVARPGAPDPPAGKRTGLALQTQPPRG